MQRAQIGDIKYEGWTGASPAAEVVAKLNAFDLVVTVALGSTLATVLLSKDVAFLEGALAFAMLAVVQWIVSRLSIASSGFRRIIRSDPRLLVKHGDYPPEAMRQERTTADEIDSAIRASGFGRMEDIGAVVLETDGSLSVIDINDRPLTTINNVKR